MEDSKQRNERLAKNTIILYIRMLVMTIIGLFTSRIVLQQLGVIDYGVYNVVGGLVVMFSFLQTALGTGTTRYITYALGQGDSKKVQMTYSTCVILHLLLSAFVLLIAETLGLWFLYNYIVIPEGSLNAVFWVYQLSVITVCLSIICIPDNTLIVAHERMNAFAYVSVFESIARFGVALLLIVFSTNKLVVYALLICSIQVVVRIIYRQYCRRSFSEIYFSYHIDRHLLKDISVFSGYVILPGLGSLTCTQGINILLNIFGGPVANAARGIAVQVQALLTRFTQSFQQATSPQITKLYATRQYEQMHSLVIKSAKFSFYIMLLPFIPLFFEISYVLNLWLVEVPLFTVEFCQYALVITLLSTIDFPFLIGASAEGKIKKLYTLGGILSTSVLPIAYLVLKAGAPLVSVYIIHLCINALCVFFELKIGGKQFGLEFSIVFRELIIPIATTFAICFFMSYGIKSLFASDGFLFFVFRSVIMVGVTVLMVLVIGMSTSERFFVREKIRLFKNKFYK